MNDNDDQKTLLEMCQLICALILACFVIGAFTYSCTQPYKLNPEEQAIRVIENNKMIACTRAGGSWMLLSAKNGTTEMSCITSTTLPLATKMNTGD